MSIRLGEKKLEGIEVPGAIMVHPYFWGNEPLPLETTEPEKRSLVERSWNIVRQTSKGCDDPLINPTMDPRLSGLGCNRVLICVAEKDLLRHRGWHYKEVLSKSGWAGVAEVMDAPGEDHAFHLFNPTCDNAVNLMKKMVSFINEGK